MRVRNSSKASPSETNQSTIGLAAEVRCVLLGEVSPHFSGRSSWAKMADTGAGRNACATVDALDRIDEQLICLSVARFVLLGVDAIDRTSVYAGGVLGADTGFCNDVCHLWSLRGALLSTLIVAQDTRGIPGGK